MIKAGDISGIRFTDSRDSFDARPQRRQSKDIFAMLDAFTVIIF